MVLMNRLRLRHRLPRVFLAFAVVALGWGIWWMYGFWQQWPATLTKYLQEPDSFRGNLEALGQIGDSYGALNAAIAGLAFSGVLVTILIQLLASQDQAVQNHKEQFESRFFQLLELGRKLREEVQFSHTPAYSAENPNADGHLKRGFAAFEAMHADLGWHLRDWDKGADLSEDRDNLGAMYRSVVHDSSEATISPYFRILYTILRRIDEDDLLSTKDKHAYYKLVRSQITSAELSVASLNGMFRESANFSYFLEKARMFKYMPASQIKNVITPHYWFGAFLGRDAYVQENPPKRDSVLRKPSGQPWLNDSHPG